jgi:hypothetical protein
MSFGPQKLLCVLKMVGPQPEGGGPDFSGDAGLRYNNRFLLSFYQCDNPGSSAR